MNSFGSTDNFMKFNCEVRVEKNLKDDFIDLEDFYITYSIIISVVIARQKIRRIYY